MEQHAHTNRLIDETSPYLLQHAHNPVDWYPWGAEALERARREDKPILLSVGYSACHWCHVMEHESFEDEGVARVMNELFVCIKVDREERPDLDKIYQTAHQLLTQRPGGWPLNMFLTPDDHLPFFGGTYFPKAPRHGLPAFTELLQQLATVYRQRRTDIGQQNAALKDFLARIETRAPASEAITPHVLERARAQFKGQFDARHGGFGRAPKFPHPTSIEFLLRFYAQRAASGQPDSQALHMARFTLEAMAQGGLYDQLGGGFCRYSVDDTWTIPHFEKMLYDNAQLLPLYADAAAATGDARFERIVVETADWVLREMQSPNGGYYSTLDADSEGHEGKFYAWSTDEIRGLLTPGEWDIVEAHYGLQGAPNFEGQWHLRISTEIAALAEKLGRPVTEIEQKLAAARAKLYAARDPRVHPGRDEKILTSWNGLMIGAMARAARRTGRTDFLRSAEHAFEYVHAQLWRDGRLLATAKDGKAHLNAYLDDYVFLIDGGLELLQQRFRAGDLEFIIALAEVVLDEFEDPDAGGFYFTGRSHEPLAHRMKPTSDDALPSGNGVAARVLLRLGHLLGETHYLDAAEHTLKALYGTVTEYPQAHGALLIAIEEYLYPPQIIVLRGDEAGLADWLTRCQKSYAPRRLSFAIPDSAIDLPGVLAMRVAKGVTTAYVCRGHACQAPVTSTAELEAALAS